MNTYHIHPTLRRWPAILAALVLPLLAAGQAAGGEADASKALESAKMERSINGQSYEEREALLTDIDSRLKTASAAVRALEMNTKRGLFGGAPKGLKEAIAEAESREGELRRRLDEARMTSPEKWSAVRSELASGYSAYAEAVTKAEAAAAEAQKG